MALYPTKNPETLNGLSLCTGVGGLELGLHIAEPGYRTVCYVERESFAAATLVARMEDKALDHAPVWDDVKTFDGSPWRGKVHILSAGYPCQPFSSSGLRKGKDDPRHLWPDIARIIRECQPEWVFCENVEGHLDRGFEDVVRDLQDMGFAVKAGLFSAAEAGASHIRRRLFILAHANDKHLLLPDRNSGIGQGFPVSTCRGHERHSTFDRQHNKSLDGLLASEQGHGTEAGTADRIPLFAPPPCDLATWDKILARRLDLQPELFGLDNGVAHRVERTRSAGNGVVSMAAAIAYCTLREAYRE